MSLFCGTVIPVRYMVTVACSVIIDTWHHLAIIVLATASFPYSEDHQLEKNTVVCRIKTYIRTYILMYLDIPFPGA